jgi:hypothetical protein
VWNIPALARRTKLQSGRWEGSLPVLGTLTAMRLIAKLKAFATTFEFSHTLAAFRRFGSRAVEQKVQR